LYCKIGFAKGSNLGCVDLFLVAWGTPMAVGDNIIPRILLFVPAQLVENIPERMNHKPTSITYEASLGVVVAIGLEIGCCQVSLKPRQAHELLGLEGVG